MMRLRLLQNTIQRMIVAVAIVAISLAVMVHRGRLIDKLQSPIAVTGWSERGLALTDGRSVCLVGIRVLPRSSAALTEATRRGVELNGNGRVYGLVRVHHWCGNDSMREHVARVDLSYLLAFVGEGETIGEIDPALKLRMAEKPGGRFSAWGWEVSEYLQFQGWCRRAEAAGGALTPHSVLHSEQKAGDVGH